METSTSGISVDNDGRSVKLRKRQMMRIENPFTFKVGQVFTGFGIGCGLGIGVGRPLNLGAIPVLNQVMSAASGATYAFSGIGRNVNDTLKKMGAKNIEAGIGCGLGFGHGFGIGLAVKPGVVHQMQSYIVEAMSKLIMKLGVAPHLSIDQSVLPASMQRGMSMVSEHSTQNQLGNKLGSKILQSTTHSQHEDRNWSTESAYQNLGSQGAPIHSQTRKVINTFLQNPVLRDRDPEINETGEQLQSENRMLRMVLRHQELIEDLMEENEKLRQILMEELKMPSTKFESRSYYAGNRLPCTDCFDCRRKQRRR
ncbi:hypothetical protein Nepgr_024645 [Nepenthes gracilis]|uniref:Uncharacterized protein n=1 Tax=Nepenthes gracilis TaxID=150966 RepID=A0AAD3T6C2_NEPGR|nr:hypothetical protein Nepgr_024645 [Nepenthes gracilis]